MTYDVDAIRADFPILSREVNGQPLCYLDNGASAQKPRVVIDAVTRGYAEEYANVHRGLHFLSNLATEKYEAVRGTIARFLNAASEDEIVLNSGTTEGINMISYAWAAPRLQAGDEIVLSTMEHHANIVPWHFLRERQGVVLKWVDPELDGSLDPQKVLDAIGPKTKLIAITQCSNVLGTVVDVKTICAGAREKGVATLVDGSQGAVHMPVDVQDIGCDFYAITGHKLYGPSGSGAIYVHADRAAEMRPFLGGGDMIREVSKDVITYNDAPLKFEAGTTNYIGAVGLAAAVDYLQALGLEAVAEHEQRLLDHALERLSKVPGLTVYGRAPERVSLVSFLLEGVHPYDTGMILDKLGIAVRTGTHCTEPLLQHFGITGTVRASFALYNTLEEVERLYAGLLRVVEMFR